MKQAVLQQCLFPDPAPRLKGSGSKGTESAWEAKTKGDLRTAIDHFNKSNPGSTISLSYADGSVINELDGVRHRIYDAGFDPEYEARLEEQRDAHVRKTGEDREIASRLARLNATSHN
jgi:hypothetical protein